MFGYITPDRTGLRVCDNRLYEAIYCGICRELRLGYGAAASLSLSYDLVFPAALSIGSESKPTGYRKRCPFHPLKGRLCADCGGVHGTKYAAACGVILAFAKLGDDLRDRAILPKLRAALLMPVIHRSYRKAATYLPGLERTVSSCMERQRRTERSGTRSLDRLSEPSAAMTGAVFREIGGFDPDLRTLLGNLGYMLGRYVYICDALDDLERDVRCGDVNPFVPRGTKYADSRLRREAVKSAEQAVNLTIGSAEELYSRLPAKLRTPVTDNIIYTGLHSRFSEISERVLRSSRKHIKDKKV